MNCLYLLEPELHINYERGPCPDLLTPNSVLIKITHCGVCLDDLLLLTGDRPPDAAHASIPGHEMAGVVQRVGAAVARPAPGDAVLVDASRACRLCALCRTGRRRFCRGRAPQRGGWAEFAVCDWRRAHRLPAGVAPAQAALFGALRAVAASLDALGGVTVGKRVLIIGANFVGAMYASVLHCGGHRAIAMCDPKPGNLELARKIGLGLKLMSPFELRRQQALDGDFVFDVLFLTISDSKLLEIGISLLDLNGRIGIFSTMPQNAPIEVSQLEVFRKQLKISTCISNSYGIPKYLELLRIMSEKYLRLSKLSVRTFDLSQYMEAFRQLIAGEIFKAVFRCSY